MKAPASKKIRIMTGITLVFSILIMSNGCTKDSMADIPGTGGDPGGSKGPGANEVYIQNMAFNPASITVQANTTIKWTNKDGVAHTVTSDTGLFDSGSLSNGSTFSYTFKTQGTFFYHCTPHPSMTASVTVN